MDLTKYELPSGNAGAVASSENFNFCEFEYHWPANRKKCEKALQESLKELLKVNYRWEKLKDLLCISLENYSDEFNMQLCQQILDEMKKLESE